MKVMVKTLVVAALCISGCGSEDGPGGPVVDFGGLQRDAKAADVRPAQDAAVVDASRDGTVAGDGSAPAAWLDPVLANTVLLTAEQIADAVLTIIADDQRSGECLVINNPESRRGGPLVHRLRNPAAYYQHIVDSLK